MGKLQLVLIVEYTGYGNDLKEHLTIGIDKLLEDRPCDYHVRGYSITEMK